jgi:hypothetical protein
LTYSVNWANRYQQVIKQNEYLIKSHASKTLSALVYYSWAVDSTLLTTLSAIAALQSNGTQAVTKEACTSSSTMLLCTPMPAFHYHICNMILAVHTDASCLSKIGGKSRAAGHF